MLSSNQRPRSISWQRMLQNGGVGDNCRWKDFPQVEHFMGVNFGAPLDSETIVEALYSEAGRLQVHSDG